MKVGRVLVMFVGCMMVSLICWLLMVMVFFDMFVLGSFSFMLVCVLISMVCVFCGESCFRGLLLLVFSVCKKDWVVGFILVLLVV